MPHTLSNSQLLIFRHKRLLFSVIAAAILIMPELSLLDFESLSYPVRLFPSKLRILKVLFSKSTFPNYPAERGPNKFPSRSIDSKLSLFSKHFAIYTPSLSVSPFLAMLKTLSVLFSVAFFTKILI